MIEVKKIAEYQKILNGLKPSPKTEARIQSVQEVVARNVELMTSLQYSEFLGHCQNYGMSAKEVMTQKQAAELVVKFDKIRSY